MRIEEVQADEENRVDLFLLRVFGGYDAVKRRLLSYFNPRLDVLNFYVGLKVWIPESADIKALPDLRGFYNLVR